uniref:Uncharacterized protein n=1 Tax=Romanomermis culicivorax TaxID=13658 RepID=A0A915JYA6_ROMCU
MSTGCFDKNPKISIRDFSIKTDGGDMILDSQGQSMKVFDYAHFRKLWDEFFYSTDKEALGNNLFGLMPAEE